MSRTVERVLKLRVPVIVEIGRRSMALADVLALGPGAILELDKNAGDDLTIRINNKPIGVGGAVKVGENFGLQIEAIAPPTDRVRALGTR